MLAIQKEITLLNDIKFNVYEGTKLVNFSGGADSTLVLYQLMNNCTDNLIVATKLFNQPHLKNLALVNNLLKTLISMTQNWNVQHVIIYKPGIDIDKNDYWKNYNIDVMYTGVTLNPPAEVYNAWITDTDCAPRETIRDNHGIKDTVYQINNHFVYSPFVNYDKKTIAQIYKSEGLFDDLFPLTNSCTEETSPNLTHCGTCWWCHERRWAFGTL